MRTQADVDRAVMIHNKIIAGTATAAEIAEWEAGMPGAYNYFDINAVHARMEELAPLLTAAGYKVQLLPFDEYELNDYFDALPAYLANIEACRAALAVKQTTPATPTDIRSYTDANDIDIILDDVNELYENMTEIYRYSGEIFAGEDNY